MKFSVFAVLLVVAGAFAMPEVDEQTRESRLVAGTINNIVQQVRNLIVDIGLDPVDIESINLDYVPVPHIVEVRAFADLIHFSGLSNIVVQTANYNALLNRLRFAFVLPELRMSIGNSGLNANIFGNRYNGEFSGSLAIRGIRFGGEVRVNIGIISGISIRSLSIDVNLGGIESDLNLKVLGADYSDYVNELLNIRIPRAFQENRQQINRLLESIIREILDEIL